MEISSVVVIGAGTMGSGIAQWFAQQLVPTILCDNNPAQAEKARVGIVSSWEKLVEKKKLTSEEVVRMKSILQVKSWQETDRHSALVIEAIIENLEVKKKLFKDLCAHFSAATIIASNTSSFPITQMAQELPHDKKAKFLGLHFFNPATLMKLVEVIRGQDTDIQLAQDLYQWFESKGKEPALCADAPGFIVNRVARNFYGEPLRIVGTADEGRMKEVDRLLKEVVGFKMGPFELMDLIGIDVNYAVTCSVWEAFEKAPRFAPHALQKQMVDEGRFGKKTKRGYYRYE
jgi:3-hydroxybutyryl-CoA dehydrogenase